MLEYKLNLIKTLKAVKKKKIKNKSCKDKPSDLEPMKLPLHLGSNPAIKINI